MTGRPFIISQARTGSTRLPAKIFEQINGRSLLSYHVERLKQAGLPIIIATTTSDADSRVVEFAVNNDLQVFRGSEENVLSRFYYAAKEANADVVIRVTSDCPLIDGSLIARAFRMYQSFNDDTVYLSNVLTRTFPRGMDFEIFSFRLLEDAFLNAADHFQLEHVTPYINRNVSGKVKLRDFKNEEDKSMYRVTVDTPEDLELVRRLISDHQCHLHGSDYITGILDSHPELVKINAHIAQKAG